MGTRLLTPCTHPASCSSGLDQGDSESRFTEEGIYWLKTSKNLQSEGVGWTLGRAAEALVVQLGQEHPCLCSAGHRVDTGLQLHFTVKLLLLKTREGFAVEELNLSPAQPSLLSWGRGSKMGLQSCNAPWSSSARTNQTGCASSKLCPGSPVNPISTLAPAWPRPALPWNTSHHPAGLCSLPSRSPSGSYIPRRGGRGSRRAEEVLLSPALPRSRPGGFLPEMLAPDGGNHSEREAGFCLDFFWV